MEANTTYCGVAGGSLRLVTFVVCGSQMVDTVFVSGAGASFLLTLRKQLQNACCVEM